LEGKQHPDRDGQFRHINEQGKAFARAGDRVISVDCKKKEIVGPYKNTGRQWRPQGDPVRVSTHDFPDKDLGKAVPDGIYDLTANTGWVGRRHRPRHRHLRRRVHPPLVARRRTGASTHTPPDC
jgi:hypothetical protein